ncbi:MAG TPA: sugar phosphate isomerase/epimerase [Tepidisphaeraceae bacterium]|jgi:sugar phosphate isomerase/epimerase|nr:sugar phosphate isomerase/epimerase [Tepidisphaeraceae bacterium]
MPSSQIGAQLYTLRDFLKTPADIAKTLARVKKIGYDAVQVSALGPIDSKELAKILQNEGLVCAATHLNPDQMANETQKVIDDHKLWNCKYTAIGGFFQKQFVTQDWLDFSTRYNDIAKKFAGSGISIGYHNHSHEMVRYDGKQAMQILIEKLDPSVWFEIDTYWITHGGGDPAQWIDKVKGRIPCVHFKDMAIKTDRVQYMAEVGVGNLNWPKIIQSCKAAGVEWYLIEQDTCYRDPFDSLETSIKNLKEMGIN